MVLVQATTAAIHIALHVTQLLLALVTDGSIFSNGDVGVTDFEGLCLSCNGVSSHVAVLATAKYRAIHCRVAVDQDLSLMHVGEVGKGLRFSRLYHAALSGTEHVTIFKLTGNRANGGIACHSDGGLAEVGRDVIQDDGTVRERIQDMFIAYRSIITAAKHRTLYRTVIN